MPPSRFFRAIEVPARYQYRKNENFKRNEWKKLFYASIRKRAVTGHVNVEYIDSFQVAAFISNLCCE
jgi:hypothetical protein